MQRQCMHCKHPILYQRTLSNNPFTFCLIRNYVELNISLFRVNLQQRSYEAVEFPLVFYPFWQRYTLQQKNLYQLKRIKYYKMQLFIDISFIVAAIE